MNEKTVIQERLKKKAKKLETTGGALIALGALEMFLTTLTPLLGIVAIGLGGIIFSKGWRLMRGKK